MRVISIQGMNFVDRLFHRSILVSYDTTWHSIHPANDLPNRIELEG